MSLATRCTACGTVFRVVQDQLKVSDGWVRCGRCGEVFNALEGLFDLDATRRAMRTPADAPAPSRAPPVASRRRRRRRRPRHDAPTPQRAGAADDGRAGSATGRRPVDAAPVRAAQRRGAPSAVPELGERDRVDFADAPLRLRPAPTTPTVAPTPTLRRRCRREPADAARRARRARLLRRAERARALAAPAVRARARRRRRRCSRSLLALQAAHHFRDVLAARWPARAAGARRAGARCAGCTLEAPRRIDDVAVESTALDARSPAHDAFRLAVALRNRGA